MVTYLFRTGADLIQQLEHDLEKIDASIERTKGKPKTMEQYKSERYRLQQIVWMLNDTFVGPKGEEVKFAELGVRKDPPNPEDPELKALAKIRDDILSGALRK